MLADIGYHFAAGGWAMGLILFWLVCSVGVIIERFIFLFSTQQNIEVFRATIVKCILSRDITRALSLCQRTKTPIGRITLGGLMRLEEGLLGVQSGMDEEALRELPRLNARIGYLALYANLAMLSGLFGTIIGLIKSFGAVGAESVDPSSKARLLAEGISEAMNCTAFGLFSAIVALVGYSCLNAWAQSQEDDTHKVTVQIYNKITETYR